MSFQIRHFIDRLALLTEFTRMNDSSYASQVVANHMVGSRQSLYSEGYDDIGELWNGIGYIFRLDYCIIFVVIMTVGWYEMRSLLSYKYLLVL